MLCGQMIIARFVFDQNLDGAAAASGLSGHIKFINVSSGTDGTVASQSLNSTLHSALVNYTELSDILVQCIRKYNETSGGHFSLKVSAVLVFLVSQPVWIAILSSQGALTQEDTYVRNDLIGRALIVVG
jgi:hypothetical protein